MEPNKDVPEVPEIPETEQETVETPEAPKEPSVDQEKEDLRKKLEESESKRKQLHERLKKQDVPSQSGFDLKELRALQDVHDEDLDMVTKYAKDNKLSILEAKNFLKPILDTRTAERTTAQATQIKGGSRGSAKVSGEDLLDRAESTGEVPEDTAGMQELFRARLARKVKGKK